MNIFLSDILTQPAALRRMLAASDFHELERLRTAIQNQRFKRILLTGMGASLNALYPAWLKLSAAGLPAIWADAAEVLHHAPALIGPDSLVWLASQSGRSAEIIGLVELVESRKPDGVLAITNEIDSPLGQAAMRAGGVLLPLHADPEQTVSTRTYLNTLALGQIAAASLADEKPFRQSIETSVKGLQQTARALEAFLQAADGLLSRLSSAAEGRKFPPRLMFLGRGASLASALTGALNVQEAAKLPAQGLQAGEFRHGPLEVADEDLSVWIFLGDPAAETASFNRHLWAELRVMGVDAWLVGEVEDEEEGVLKLPGVPTIGLPLVEIPPVQLLGYHLSEKQGLEPGQFRHIQKVTESE
jgi:glucosamine--fructose-6-phosphate aminotransferase (isomerizing)